ncbi:MAG: radical SAM protein [Oscillospiraceae bacterium]|nr:radical SAM protein [Candidatus Equicaccousia limihippi]
MTECEICPRRCKIDRTVLVGYCKEGNALRLSRAALHFWEEPIISGKNGSGTAFFCGCNLGCVFCQNRDISSAQNNGTVVSPDRLYEIFGELIGQGAHNINLVTPTHYTDVLAELLARPLSVPVVWNSSGYENVNSLKTLKNKVQIFLPDLKFCDNVLSQRLAGAPDYFTVAQKAIAEMLLQQPTVEIKNGIMQKGVMVRHLVLPGHIENTKRAIDLFASEYKGAALFSLMFQYTPVNGCKPPLDRRVNKSEYNEVVDYLYRKNIEDGFVQELSSAKEEYVPDFDGTGII